MGNNGSPASAFPLARCQGDCDNDDECGEGLICMQRSGDEPVPGCVGSPGTGTDYCVPSETTAPTTNNNPPGPPDTPSPVAPSPTSSPNTGDVTYVPGEATVRENGLLLSTGLTSRIIATMNTKVQYDAVSYTHLTLPTKRIV